MNTGIPDLCVSEILAEIIQVFGLKRPSSEFDSLPKLPVCVTECVFVHGMRSSWSIHDFPPADGEAPAPQPDLPLPKAPLTWKEKEAIRFAALRNRPDRKGRGARRRAGEKKWATKGK